MEILVINPEYSLRFVSPIFGCYLGYLIWMVIVSRATNSFSNKVPA